MELLLTGGGEFWKKGGVTRPTTRDGARRITRGMDEQREPYGHMHTQSVREQERCRRDHTHLILVDQSGQRAGEEGGVSRSLAG